MESLIRIKVDNFELKDSITLDNLEKSDNKENYIINIEKLFESNDNIELDSEKNKLFLNGARIKTRMLDDFYRVYSNEKFIGIGIVKDGILKRDIVI